MLEKTLILKPTTACNFNCTFCSAKGLNIPLHDHIPQVLKDFFLDYKPTNLIITGGDPLMNPRSYLEEVIEVMATISPDYHISLTSNMVLWDKDPEKYDYLFQNPHIGVITSFQYGGERKDTDDYSEQRFLEVFNKFYDRYGIKLPFIYVVNENNEQYALKACELAKRLGTTIKLNQQHPLGASTIFYPTYKILDLHIKAIEAGYEAQLNGLRDLRLGKCSFPISSYFCNFNKVAYVDQNEELQVSVCEDRLTTHDFVAIDNTSLFRKCYNCKMFSLCNGCSIHKHYTEPIKEEQCQWMQENKSKLIAYGFTK